MLAILVISKEEFISNWLIVASSRTLPSVSFPLSDWSLILLVCPGLLATTFTVFETNPVLT